MTIMQANLTLMRFVLDANAPQEVMDAMREINKLIDLDKSSETSTNQTSECRYCYDRGYITIHGLEDTDEDCPRCSGTGRQGNLD